MTKELQVTRAGVTQPFNQAALADVTAESDRGAAAASGLFGTSKLCCSLGWRVTKPYLRVTAKDSRRSCMAGEARNAASGVSRLLLLNVVLIPPDSELPFNTNPSQTCFFSLSLCPSVHLSVCRCFAEDTCITIPDIDAVVMVLQPSEPRITITGADRLTRPVADFGPTAGGVALFQELHIVSTVTRADADGDDERMSTRRPGSERQSSIHVRESNHILVVTKLSLTCSSTPVSE